MDSMDLEREKGITIRAKKWILNPRWRTKLPPRAELFPAFPIFASTAPGGRHVKPLLKSLDFIPHGPVQRRTPNGGRHSGEIHVGA